MTSTTSRLLSNCSLGHIPRQWCQVHRRDPVQELGEHKQNRTTKRERDFPCQICRRAEECGTLKEVIDKKVALLNMGANRVAEVNVTCSSELLYYHESPLHKWAVFFMNFLDLFLSVIGLGSVTPDICLIKVKRYFILISNIISNNSRS